MPSYQETARQNFIKELEARESPEAWNAYKKEKIESVMGKLDYPKCEKFADYLNRRFMDAAMANNAVGISQRWTACSDDEKIEFAQKIVDTLIRLLDSDIQYNHVQTYNNDGGEYKKTNDFFDGIYKNEIATYIHNFVKIKVKKSDNGLMGITKDRQLHINLDWPLYKGFELFLMDLRHEMMHMVDIYISQISVLDPDVRMTSIRYYIGGDDSDFQLYKENPLELNANLKRREFRIMCTEMISNAICHKIKSNQIPYAHERT